MPDLLRKLVTLKGSRRIQWRRTTRRGGTFKFLTDARIEREDGRVLLRFSNGIANEGAGPLEVGGDPRKKRTRNGRREMPAYQRIFNSDGTNRRVFVGWLAYDPDPDHRHWHFSGFAEYRLTAQGSGRVWRSRKQAFCLEDFDRVRRGARAAYPECEDTRMGISPGWVDTYTWDLHGQQIDITAVPSGTYRLESITNPNRRLRERSHTGNRAAARIRIDKTTGTVTVLR
ncbi:MAG: lysyl oxidase family protein [Armatimonadota bacterium]